MTARTLTHEVVDGDLHSSKDGTLVVRGWLNTPLGLGNEPIQSTSLETHFGCALTSSTLIRRRGPGASEYLLEPGMYFSAAEPIELRGGSGWVVTVTGYQGLFTLGGPVESRGRLRYIDGCTDSLLISPVRRGDPCLNLLCFPKHLAQTKHTHPSLRSGLILRGNGHCWTEHATLRLRPGAVFVIPPEVEHAFSTTTESMTIVAFHPDSDFGPTDEDHPMINRTVIDDSRSPW